MWHASGCWCDDGTQFENCCLPEAGGAQEQGWLLPEERRWINVQEGLRERLGPSLELGGVVMNMHMGPAVVVGLCNARIGCRAVALGHDIVLSNWWMMLLGLGDWLIWRRCCAAVRRVASPTNIISSSCALLCLWHYLFCFSHHQQQQQQQELKQEHCCREPGMLSETPTAAAAAFCLLLRSGVRWNARHKP